jgi:hypothetical protein
MSNIFALPLPVSNSFWVFENGLLISIQLKVETLGVLNVEILEGLNVEIFKRSNFSTQAYNPLTDFKRSKIAPLSFKFRMRACSLIVTERLNSSRLISNRL